MKYKIISSCIGCKQCYRVCPVQAILVAPMRIDEDKCIKCGECHRKCPGKKIIEVGE